MNGVTTTARPALGRYNSAYLNGANAASGPVPSIPASPSNIDGMVESAVLELNDGSIFRGFSFGAPGKSVAGECVFQTGEFLSPACWFVLHATSF